MNEKNQAEGQLEPMRLMLLELMFSSFAARLRAGDVAGVENDLRQAAKFCRESRE